MTKVPGGNNWLYELLCHGSHKSSYFQCPSSITKPPSCIAHQPPSVPVSLKSKQTLFISFIIFATPNAPVHRISNIESIGPQNGPT